MFVNKKIITVIIVFILLTLSVYIGKSSRNIDVESVIYSNFTKAKIIKKISEKFYYLYDSKKMFVKPSSLLSIADSKGYSGPIKIGVNYSKEGEIIDVKVLHQTETPGFFRMVIKAKFIDQYIGKNIEENFELDKNIDAVSGATISCVGINSAIQKANIKTCDLYFKNKFEADKTGQKVQTKDILIIFFFLFAIFLSFKKSKIQRKILPIFRIMSVVFLGFFFKGLLSITHFNNLISGNFPDNQYYWYLILGFFIFTILIIGKNLYFAYICPMGIIQDYLEKISPKKIKFKQRKYYQYPAILFTFGILSYSAITNQPGFLGYEIFSLIFNQNFSFYITIVAIISIILSLFIKRFWCRFLCPVGVIGRFLQMLRSIVK